MLKAQSKQRVISVAEGEVGGEKLDKPKTKSGLAKRGRTMPNRAYKKPCQPCEEAMGLVLRARRSAELARPRTLYVWKVVARPSCETFSPNYTKTLRKDIDG